MKPTLNTDASDRNLSPLQPAALKILNNPTHKKTTKTGVNLENLLLNKAPHHNTLLFNKVFLYSVDLAISPELQFWSFAFFSHREWH